MLAGYVTEGAEVRCELSAWWSRKPLRAEATQPVCTIGDEQFFVDLQPQFGRDALEGVHRFDFVASVSEGRRERLGHGGRAGRDGGGGGKDGYRSIGGGGGIERKSDGR